MHHYDILIIGGGPAGVTSALRARELGASVALFESGRMGGTCTNDGCVPTRVLAKAARLLRDSEQYADYGLHGTRPQLEFARLLAETQRIVYSVQEKKQLLAHLQQAGIDVWSEAGDVQFVDSHMIATADGRQFRGERIVICAGGRARRLDFPGSELALTHSDVWSLRRLPRRVVIVGAAATGCQLASVFADFGAQVTLLEAADRILVGEDRHVSREVQRRFGERAIAVVCGIGRRARLEQQKDGLRYSYQMGEEERSIDCDDVILAVGWVGNVDRLQLQNAGVATDNSYITVDDQLRTSQPHIYAAGDINGRQMLVQSAQYEARTAAENALLGDQIDVRHQIVPHGSFTDPEYGSVGLTEADAAGVAGMVSAIVPYAALDRALIDGHTTGFCKLVVGGDRRLLGAHVVGEDALEVVQIVAAGMAADMRIEQLARLEIAYPTYSAIVGLAARQILAQLGDTPVAPEWRRLDRQRLAEWERSATL